VTNIIVGKSDFDGSKIGINGIIKPVPLDVVFDADAATIEILRNANIPFLQEPFDLGQAGQIKIDRKYRGPRFVVINGVREWFPVGKWFTPSAAALALILASTAGAAVSYSSAPTAVASWQIIGQYNDTGFAAQGSNASSIQVVSRKRDIPNVDLTAVRSLEQTFFVGAASGGLDMTITNVVNIRHKLSNTTTQLAISPSPVAVPAFEGAYQILEYTGAIPAGTTLYLDKEAIVPTSGQNTGPQTMVYSNQGAAAAVGRKAGATVTFDTTSLTTGSGSLLCPITIGYGVHLYPTFGAIGDSIISSNGETYDGDGGAVGVEGRTVQGGALMRRAIYLAQVSAGRTVPLRLLSRPSAQMTGMRSSSGAGGAKRRASYPYFNHLIIQMGTNDLGNSRTAAQLKADIEAEIVAYRAAWTAANPTLPCYVIVCTILPRVGSHASTTRLAYAGEIETHNYNVRHGLIVGSDGYLDPNLAVRSVADETLWLDSADEADGLHPSPAGYAKIATSEAPYMALDSSPWRTFL
jgi:lysophospholipase L1-like esterase